MRNFNLHNASFESLSDYWKRSILLRFAVGKHENTSEGNGWESQPFKHFRTLQKDFLIPFPQKRVDKDVHLDGWAALKVTLSSGG